MRDGAGVVLKTATAAMLGLAAVASGCDDIEPVAEYGPAPTTDAATTAAATGGAGGTTTTGGAGGEFAAEYGPAPTVGVGGFGGTGGSGGIGGN